MKTTTFFSTTLAGLLILLFGAVTWSAPSLPSSFWGTVLIDGANVPDGTVVTAWINGVQYGQTNTLTWMGDSVYALDVDGDDSDTPAEIEGGVEGDTIVFKIDAVDADQTGIWHSGSNLELNLSRSVAAPQAPAVVISEEDGFPQLSWEHSSDHYEVWRSTTPYFIPGVDSEQIAVLAPSSTPVIYSDTNAVVGTNYYYTVRAFNIADAWVDSKQTGRFVWDIQSGT